MATGILAFFLALPSAHAQSSSGLLGEYYNNNGTAAAPPPPPGNPTGTTYTAAPALTRIDPLVNFDWGAGTPGSPVNIDDFMVAWTGSVLTGAAGNYLFGTRADDGSRIWVNGLLVLDNWRDQGPPANPQMGPAISLAAATAYPIRLEFYENGGGAVAQLYWTTPGTSTPAITPSANLRPPSPPVPPALSGTAFYDAPTRQPGVDLSWSAPLEATEYNVKRSTTPGGPYSTIASGVTATQYRDTGIQVETQYAYVVTAVKKEVLESGDSNEVIAMSTAPPPRTNDHEEGLVDGGRCSCGSVSSVPAASVTLMMVLSALLGFVGIPAGRRRKPGASCGSRFRSA